MAGALARGDALINLRFPHKGYREKIWDHVAGVVIVTEAGATVSDASGTPLPLSPPSAPVCACWHLPDQGSWCSFARKWNRRDRRRRKARISRHFFVCLSMLTCRQSSGLWQGEVAGSGPGDRHLHPHRSRCTHESHPADHRGGCQQSVFLDCALVCSWSDQSREMRLCRKVCLFHEI